MAAKIKICGLMRGEDAAIAAGAGASYLGVVFAAGPRTVTQRQAHEVVQASAGIPVLGVFADHPVQAILQISSLVGLSGAQLHGPYSQSVAERLRAAGLQVWRVVRIATPSDLDALVAAVPESDAVLVEPRIPTAAGGTGVRLELAVAKEARGRLGGHPMALAGGLTPESVAEAVSYVQPEIVDVSSGVESRPGVKDHTKMRRFVEAVVAHNSLI
jgi:phosphoribosylanthranilate isomerase